MSNMQLDTLRRIVQEINTSVSLHDSLEIMVNQVSQAMHVDVCSIYLLDERNQRYVLMATKGLNPESVGNVSLQLGEGLVGNAYVEVPMGTPITVAMRNKSIRDLAEKRVSQSKLARKFGVTQRTIRNVVNGEEKPKIINEDQNYDLFND